MKKGKLRNLYVSKAHHAYVEALAEFHGQTLVGATRDIINEHQMARPSIKSKSLKK